MKFSLSWLKKFLNTDQTLDVIAESLVDLGIEIKIIKDVRQSLSPFIISEIKSIRKHPEADRLNLCTIEHTDTQIEVVCGAPNVRVGMKVVFAPLGTTIPSNGLVIERRKIRGIESVGMLCSAAELGLKGDSDGILDLHSKVSVGQKFIDQCPELCDPFIEVEVTPNRSDCFSVYGIARDLSAAGIGDFIPADLSHAIKESISADIQTKIEDTAQTPLFIVRLIKNIVNKPSEGEIHSFLDAIEEETISSVVDVTNYINYAFGQPMHAYDADKIEGNLRVSLLESSEKFLALDGKEYLLEEGDLVIRDDQKICGLAGIIGGESTKCDENTKNILLEAAVFDPVIVAKAGRRLSLNTRAKHVFERGVDHNFTQHAIDIATTLIFKLAGGEASKKIVQGNAEISLKRISLNKKKIENLTGVCLDSNLIEQILEKLGFGIISNDENILELEIPSWRHDIVIEEDLVEEVIRVHGYKNIPELSLPLDTTHKTFDARSKILTRCRTNLCALGYSELITWSFMSSKVAKLFSLDDAALLLKNPISEDLNIMRKSILPNLLESVHKNLSRSISDVAFFEIGPVYDVSLEANQHDSISAVMSGNAIKRNIYKDQRNFDFFDAKAAVLELLNIFGVDESNIEFQVEDVPSWYHPGKSAILVVDGLKIGHVGEIHPLILKNMKIKTTTIGFEIFFDSLLNRASDFKNKEISNYQAVSRDFAFILDGSISADLLIKTIRSIDSDLIRNISIFDVYEGEKIESGKKSIAVNVMMQSSIATLKEQDIAEISDQIISTISKKLQGSLRQ